MEPKWFSGMISTATMQHKISSEDSMALFLLEYLPLAAGTVSRVAGIYWMKIVFNSCFLMRYLLHSARQILCQIWWQHQSAGFSAGFNGHLVSVPCHSPLKCFPLLVCLLCLTLYCPHFFPFFRAVFFFFKIETRAGTMEAFVATISITLQTKRWMC